MLGPRQRHARISASLRGVGFLGADCAKTFVEQFVSLSKRIIEYKENAYFTFARDGVYFSQNAINKKQTVSNVYKRPSSKKLRFPKSKTRL